MNTKTETYPRPIVILKYRSESNDGNMVMFVSLSQEERHEMVTAICVEVFPGVLQTKQKCIRRWTEEIEVDMNLRQTETNHRPAGVHYIWVPA